MIVSIVIFVLSSSLGIGLILLQWFMQEVQLNQFGWMKLTGWWVVEQELSLDTKFNVENTKLGKIKG